MIVAYSLSSGGLDEVDKSIDLSCYQSRGNEDGAAKERYFNLVRIMSVNLFNIVL
jgi:hypothetical protein